MERNAHDAALWVDVNNIVSHEINTFTDTYHPRLVTEVVDRVQRVDTRQSSVLQANHDVTMVSVLVHAEGVLSDQHKVWLNGPETQNISKYYTAREETTVWFLGVYSKWYLPIAATASNPTRFTRYLLSNLMSVPDCIDVHIVAACRIRHQADFREFSLKGQQQSQSTTSSIKKHCGHHQSRRAMDYYFQTW